MKFDLNPESFTLQNMFAMELHKFSDVIGDITASATKELSIEKGISEVADAWGNMKFIVSKYMKGTQERGFVLGTVDEIIQILDDNAMNLQSMSASRFVGPFLETVNKWEKSLSHIGEVVEVCLLFRNVQCSAPFKLLYYEFADKIFWQNRPYGAWQSVTLVITTKTTTLYFYLTSKFYLNKYSRQMVEIERILDSWNNYMDLNEPGNQDYSFVRLDSD